MLYNPKTLDFEISKSNTKKGYDAIGPLWVGSLKDQKLVEKMLQNNTYEKETKFLTKLQEEQDVCGFYDYHIIAKKYKIPLGKKEMLLKKLKASSTHFSPTGFKTNKKIKEIIQKLK